MMVPGESGPCTVDDNGDGVADRETGMTNQSFEHELTPTAAEVRDGVYIVVAFDQTIVTHHELAEGDCAGFAGSTLVVEGTATR
jgi:hypothetical protein